MNDPSSGTFYPLHPLRLAGRVHRAARGENLPLATPD